MQPREEIAYLGPKASYTHQAALSAFGPSDPSPQHQEHQGHQHVLSPQTSIEDVFASVQAGTAAYGVVPFENSTNGSVVFTLDLFADTRAKYPDIVVCGERYVEVHHCLLGHAVADGDDSVDGHGAAVADGVATAPAPAPAPAHSGNRSNASPSSSGHATPIPGDPHPVAPRSVPLHPLSHIKKLYSHPQAWGQCARFLSSYLKGVERQDVSSTSKAAELVAADPSGRSAAISSSIAARLHGLAFLARDVEDARDNCTRFFVLRRRDRHDDDDDGGDAAAPSVAVTVAANSNSSSSSGSSGAEPAHPRRFKSLLAFTVSHTDPGALADALAVFKAHGLNLTSINPRPSGEAPWHYMFFVEFQGRKGDAAVDAALLELGGVVRAWRWLGSWENALG